MRFLLLFLLVVIPSASAWAAPKVLMVLNQGYRPEEYFTPRKIFDAAGFNVKVAAHYMGDVLPSRPHIHEVPPIPADLTFKQVSVNDYDAIVFVGGTGAWSDFLPNPDVHRILMQSYTKGKITALICAATGLLATADNLDGSHPRFSGKHVTGYFEVAGLLKNDGKLNYDKGIDGKPYVVRDGNLITGRDPISAEVFGNAVVSALGRIHGLNRN